MFADEWRLRVVVWFGSDSSDSRKVSDVLGSPR